MSVVRECLNKENESIPIPIDRSIVRIKQQVYCKSQENVIIFLLVVVL